MTSDKDLKWNDQSKRIKVNYFASFLGIHFAFSESGADFDAGKFVLTMFFLFLYCIVHSNSM